MDAILFGLFGLAILVILGVAWAITKSNEDQDNIITQIKQAETEVVILSELLFGDKD